MAKRDPALKDFRTVDELVVDELTHLLRKNNRTLGWLADKLRQSEDFTVLEKHATFKGRTWVVVHTGTEGVNHCIILIAVRPARSKPYLAACTSRTNTQSQEAALDRAINRLLDAVSKRL